MSKEPKFCCAVCGASADDVIDQFLALTTVKELHYRRAAAIAKPGAVLVKCADKRGTLDDPETANIVEVYGRTGTIAATAEELDGYSKNMIRYRLKAAGYIIKNKGRNG